MLLRHVSRQPPPQLRMLVARGLCAVLPRRCSHHDAASRKGVAAPPTHGAGAGDEGATCPQTPKQTSAHEQELAQKQVQVQPLPPPTTPACSSSSAPAVLRSHRVVCAPPPPPRLSVLIRDHFGCASATRPLSRQHDSGSDDSGSFAQNGTAVASASSPSYNAALRGLPGPAERKLMANAPHGGPLPYYPAGHPVLLDCFHSFPPFTHKHAAPAPDPPLPLSRAAADLAQALPQPPQLLPASDASSAVLNAEAAPLASACGAAGEPSSTLPCRKITRGRNLRKASDRKDAIQQRRAFDSLDIAEGDAFSVAKDSQYFYKTDRNIDFYDADELRNEEEDADFEDESYATDEGRGGASASSDYSETRAEDGSSYSLSQSATAIQKAALLRSAPFNSALFPYLCLPVSPLLMQGPWLTAAARLATATARNEITGNYDSHLQLSIAPIGELPLRAPGSVGSTEPGIDLPVMSLDSTRRKRKRKMNKHQLKRQRKKQKQRTTR